MSENNVGRKSRTSSCFSELEPVVYNMLFFVVCLLVDFFKSSAGMAFKSWFVWVEFSQVINICVSKLLLRL